KRSNELTLGDGIVEDPQLTDRQAKSLLGGREGEKRCVEFCAAVKVHRNADSLGPEFPRATTIAGVKQFAVPDVFRFRKLRHGRQVIGTADDVRDLVEKFSTARITPVSSSQLDSDVQMGATKIKGFYTRVEADADIGKSFGEIGELRH